MRVRLLSMAAGPALLCAAGTAGWAASPFSCGAFAIAGGAQLLCSHVSPKAPDQSCTFSWALTTMTGSVSVQEGSFLLPRGVQNATVYQGSGFATELSPPIVLCQGKLSR